MPGRGVSYIWEINNLSKFHQQLWLNTQVRKQYNDPGFIMRNVNVSVHFSSRSSLEEDWHVIVDGSSTRTRVFDCSSAVRHLACFGGDGVPDSVLGARADSPSSAPT